MKKTKARQCDSRFVPEKVIVVVGSVAAGSVHSVFRFSIDASELQVQMQMNCN